MALFGGKKEDDSKSKIDALKEKIAAGGMGMPSSQEQPAPQPAPQPVQAMPAAPQPAPQSAPAMPVPQPPQPAPQSAPAMPVPQPKPVPPPKKLTQEEQEQGGIILDLGEGISINLPIKRHMDLDEFLAIAEKIKKLKILDQQEGRNLPNF